MKYSAPLAAILAGISAHAAAATNPHPQLQHIIIIMQENRSFDNYFGTFPGANGIPQGACVPLSAKHPDQGCVVPFHDVHDANAGGPHTASHATADINDGITKAKMDGFVDQQNKIANESTFCNNTQKLQPICWTVPAGAARHDVVGYHTDEEIPNYWAYAKHFVLHEAMYPGVRSWSLPSHLDLTSEWTATCTDPNKASTCTTNLAPPIPTSKTIYPWSSLFQLLDMHGVSWKYYLGLGEQPDCDDDEMTCPPKQQTTQLPSFWNPAPNFASVRAQGPAYLAAHVTKMQTLFDDVQNGTLAQVSWIVPSRERSEHPPESITLGMDYVTSLVNTVMESPYWQNTAIFIAWDDWGGFYDHVPPPYFGTLTANGPQMGLGIRVASLMVSAWAKPGYIDPDLYSFDSYAHLIEDLFAGGARLDPSALGNPDNRPYIADSVTYGTAVNGATTVVGDLINDFDFTQTPQPALVLPTDTPGGLLAVCTTTYQAVCTNTTVTLSWVAVGITPKSKQPVYHVTRDGVELKQCKGRATTCTDVPGSGTHLYRTYSVNDTGVATPQSAAAEITEP